MFKEVKSIIYNDKIKKDIRIIFISDIHYVGLNDKKRLDKIYDKIKKYEFDFICIPGDIIENTKLNDNEYFINYLGKLSSLSPVILSLGNHDLRSKNKNKKRYCCNDKYWDKIKDLDNVYLLDNNGITINGIYFYGKTLSDKYYKDENKNNFIKEIEGINNISNKNYNILLLHSPIWVSGANDLISNYDLVLSGHMHNGMVPPLLDEIIDNNVGVISPNKKLFPKYARGIVNNKNNITIISSGTIKLSRMVSIPLRLFNNIYPIGLNYIIIKKGNNHITNSIRYFK